MEIINSSEFAWFVCASFALVMVYRHIMQRMTDMKRTFQQEIRESYDSWHGDTDLLHQRIVKMQERIDSLEAACACKTQSKDKAPYNSTGYYNTEA